MKPSTVRKHIQELRKFINAPTSAESASENIIRKRLAYLVETVLRYETEKTVGWRKPLDEVLNAADLLMQELNIFLLRRI